MELDVALPPGWRQDLGSLTMLVALDILSAHGATVIAPEGERPTLQDQQRFGLALHERSGKAERSGSPARILFAPVSVASARWVASLGQDAATATVLFGQHLVTEPRLWPDLARLADGVVLCEPGWCALLHAAAPDLPALLLSPEPEPPDKALSRSDRPPPPYLVTWSPADARSVSLIAEAIALLAAGQPDLQLVVLGGAGCAVWQRWLRAFGLLHRSWLLGENAYRRAGDLMAGAVATVAPMQHGGCSTTLLCNWGAVSAPPHVALAEGGSNWVSVADGVPQVQVEGHDAAQTLAHTLAVLLAIEPQASAGLAGLRRTTLARRAHQQRQRVAPFLDAVWARHSRSVHVCGRPLADGLAAHYASLAADALGALGLTEVASPTAQAIAQSIAELAT